MQLRATHAKNRLDQAGRSTASNRDPLRPARSLLTKNCGAPTSDRERSYVPPHLRKLLSGGCSGFLFRGRRQFQIRLTWRVQVCSECLWPEYPPPPPMATNRTEPI